MSQMHTLQHIRDKQNAVFRLIPGMRELLSAKPSEIQLIEQEYPDAAFALFIANNLFHHNRELSLITQKAYFSILNGENIASVRYCYNRETDEYWKVHMWDD